MTSPQRTYSEQPETYMSHGWEKCKRQPLVPLGILATCAALIGATGSLRSGNRTQFNKYLRLRVAAQGITVIAAVAGALLLTDKTDEIKEQRERALTNQLPPDPTASRVNLRNEESHPDLIGSLGNQGSYSSTGAKQTRVKASDFTRRLREAEGLQAEEDAFRKAQGKQ